MTLIAGFSKQISKCNMSYEESQEQKSQDHFIRCKSRHLIEFNESSREFRKTGDISQQRQYTISPQRPS